MTVIKTLSCIDDSEILRMMKLYPQVSAFKEEWERRQSVKQKQTVDDWFADATVNECKYCGLSLNNNKDNESNDRADDITHRTWTADSLNKAMKKKINEVEPGLEMLI